MSNIPINVSKKILADISSGIYRTPANALKELVSNSFDASAHRVHISTNVPYFDVFTCEDDGEGISAEDFEKIISIIGSSKKREKGDFSQKTNRPIIGKIGIGMLAVAQICNKFTVISKKKGIRNFFEATIDLKQFEKVEKEKSYLGGEGEISLGTCQIETNLEDEDGPEKHYTKIIMEELKPGFKAKLLQEEDKRVFSITEKAAKSENLLNFIESIKNKNFNELSQYDQLIWELGLLCPVEYLENGPLPDSTSIKSEIEQLKNYNFKVFVDGFEIRKPILLPTDKNLKKNNMDYKIYPHIFFEKKLNKADLKFTGYIFHQRKRIQPAGLQGVLIRIKGVGVGNYDRTFLHYPKAEGPMFNQLSGEIFVEKGLEEALNIDRNSFNETHPHFLRLQQFLWDYLGTGENAVFRDIRRRSKERQEIIHVDTFEKELTTFRKSIEKIFGISITITRKEKKYREPYVYNKENREIVIFSHPFWAKNRRERMLQEKLILAITAAKHSSNSIDFFEKQALKLFAKGK